LTTAVTRDTTALSNSQIKVTKLEQEIQTLGDEQTALLKPGSSVPSFIPSVPAITPPVDTTDMPELQEDFIPELRPEPIPVLFLPELLVNYTMSKLSKLSLNDLKPIYNSLPKIMQTAQTTTTKYPLTVIINNYVKDVVIQVYGNQGYRFNVSDYAITASPEAALAPAPVDESDVKGQGKLKSLSKLKINNLIVGKPKTKWMQLVDDVRHKYKFNLSQAFEYIKKHNLYKK